MRVSWSLVAIVGLLAGAFFLPYFIAPFWVGIAREVLIFAIFATSINVLLGYGGLPTLGQAGISGAAAYVVAIMVTSYGMASEIAALIALVAGTVVSVVFGLLSVRTHGTYFLLITLAQGMIIWGIAARWTTVTGGQNGIRGIVRPEWLEPYWLFYWFVLAVLIATLLVVRQIAQSPFGLTLRGVRESESRARALGYNVPGHRLAAFVLSGSIASIAGVLLVLDKHFVSPSAAGLARSAEGLLMVILGGSGTLAGPVVGATLLVVTRNVVSIWTDRWSMILGTVFVLTVLFAPNGIVPAVRRVVRSGVSRVRTGQYRDQSELIATGESSEETT